MWNEISKKFCQKFGRFLNESLFSENPDDDMNYEFLIDGCPNPDEPDTDSLQIISNGQAAAASFSLASFMFHEDLDAEIYLHCEVRSFCAIYVCENIRNKNCSDFYL